MENSSKTEDCEKVFEDEEVPVVSKTELSVNVNEIESSGGKDTDSVQEGTPKKKKTRVSG